MRRTIQRSLVIVVASATLGVVVNAVRSDVGKDGKLRCIPFVTPPKAEIRNQEFVPLALAHELWSSGSAFFLDARAPADYAAGHIANALSLPAEAFDQHFPQVASYLTTDSVIVCYCDGTECDISHRVAELLRQRGYTNVRILKNGYTEWNKAAYPTTKGANP